MTRESQLQQAVALYREGRCTFSELAQLSGLNIEEIMDAVTSREGEAALQMFEESCRALASLENDPEFLRRAQRAVERVRRSSPTR